MQQGFDRFHAACNHQRQLLIAVECLLHHIEDLKNGASGDNQNLPEDLTGQIVHLSHVMTLDMESFTGTLLRQKKCPESARQFLDIEDACHQLLDANIAVAQTAMAAASKYGHAPWITRALVIISARNEVLHTLLREHKGLTPFATAVVRAQY